MNPGTTPVAGTAVFEPDAAGNGPVSARDMSPSKHACGGSWAPGSLAFPIGPDQPSDGTMPRSAASSRIFFWIFSKARTSIWRMRSRLTL